MKLDSLSMQYETYEKRLREWLGLESHPVAVFLVAASGESETRTLLTLQHHRYCQAVMRARNGHSVRLLPESLSCPAAAAVFGFRPLPKGLSSGKGLTGLGITRFPETGRRMFNGMTRLDEGTISEIILCPLGRSFRTPDVVVVEAEPEKLMWLLLADLNRAGGERRSAHTAVLQATCVDSTLVPHVEKRLNFSFGCYGCREATDMGAHEAILGFPGELLDPLMVELEHLADRALPRSRSKKAFRLLNSLSDGRQREGLPPADMNSKTTEEH